ncbi:MAG: hypothetical protein ACI8UO_005234, partial [Verrucomicrobiales bacterium]
REPLRRFRRRPGGRAPRHRRSDALQAAGATGAFEEEFDGVVFAEDIEVEGLDLGAEVAETRGDDDVSAAEPTQQLLDGGGGRFVVDVVENEEPAGMVVEPVQGGGDAGIEIGRGVFGEIEDERPGELGEVALEVFGGVGAEKEQGVVFAGVAVAVFDGEPGFADAAKAVDSLSGDDSGGAPIDQASAKVVEEGAAAFEEAADGGGEIEGTSIGDVAEVTAEVGLDFVGEIGFRVEGLGVATVDGEAVEMTALRVILVFGIAVGVDEEGDAVMEGEEGFGLSVGEVREVAESGLEIRQLPEEAGGDGAVFAEVGQGALGAGRAGLGADDVDEGGAGLDEVVEFAQGVGGGLGEVVLDFDGVASAEEAFGAAFAQLTEFVGDGGEEDGGVHARSLAGGG